MLWLYYVVLCVMFCVVCVVVVCGVLCVCSIRGVCWACYESCALYMICYRSGRACILSARV